MRLQLRVTFGTLVYITCLCSK